MSIFIESRASEINIPSGIRVDGLEEWTGADILISRLMMPCKNRILLSKHIEGGAIMAQIKYGEDLAASIGDRLNESIARMREVTRRIPQHWLIYVGTLGADSEGFALINGQRTHMGLSFATVDGGICGWIARGGVFYQLSRVGLLSEWCCSMERRLEEYHTHYYKYVFGKPNFPDDLPNITEDVSNSSKSTEESVPSR